MKGAFIDMKALTCVHCFSSRSDSMQMTGGGEFQN